MRILELEIRNVRGIKELRLLPNGKNMVIWGPNGSVKSAVVDAIDFLLTGRISRLVGEGTAGLSLKSHGPHIDHDAKDATVKAKILLPSHSEPIHLERSISAPAQLICSAGDRKLLEPILQLASQGQHVLSRREILRYVAAEAAKRATEVQALLNLSELEDIRKAFGRVSTTTKSDLRSAETAVMSARSAVQSTLALPSYDDAAVSTAVNNLRSILGAHPLTDFKSENVKDGIISPSLQTREPGINLHTLQKARAGLDQNLDNLESGIHRPDVELRSTLEDLRANPASLSEASKLQLMQLGVTKIDSDGSCPLCGVAWEPGRLRDHLEEHIRGAKTTKEKLAKIEQLGLGISNATRSIHNQILQLSHAADHLKMRSELAELLSWSSRLTTFLKSLEEPLASYPGPNNSTTEVARLFAPETKATTIGNVVKEAELKIPPVSPEQTAWDTLTSLRENLRQHEAAKARVDNAKLHRDRASVLETCFEAVRDKTLDALYSTIESRFSTLYKFVHENDEPQFETTIRPSGAGLAFEVDFYGRGKFPPLALHSEGHQDTMGICLYLVLAEKLTQNIIELTILDDVVMSVDSGHRRRVCDLLASQFPNRQFLITTHDRTWARQLTTTGVMPRSNSVEFSRWTLETGPFVSNETIGPIFWNQIHTDIDKGDIPAAAARLRRGGEEFFEQVCDNLRASVRYRSDGRWEFSDFVSGSIGIYRKYLRAAKAAASSWHNSELTVSLNEMDSVASQIIQRSQIEQWGINENVHYNRWEQFAPGDFRPISEAWRDLTELFRCSSCDGVLFVSMDGQESTALRCPCAHINLNLIEKS
ncbi:MAG: AAA family ATPase [Candidatus Acidiferrum sp.]